MVTLTLVYALLALASVGIIFLAAYLVRGLKLALLASGVTFVGLCSLFVVMLIIVTSQM